MANTCIVVKRELYNVRNTGVLLVQKYLSLRCVGIYQNKFACLQDCIFPQCFHNVTQKYYK